MKKIFALVVICLSMQAADAWVGKYVTNRVESALAPYSITVCDSIKYYRGSESNSVSVSTITPGDKVSVVVSIPTTNFNWSTNANVRYLANIVGYTRFDVPLTNLSALRGLRFDTKK